MSDSTTPSETSVATVTAANPDTLWSQAFIFAMCLLPIGAGVLWGAFKYLSSDVAASLAGTAIGLTLGAPSGYFFGAAKHTAPAPAAAGGVVTTTTTPPTTRTTTTP